MKGEYSFLVVFTTICASIAMTFYGIVNEGTIGSCIAAVGVVMFLWAVNNIGAWERDDKTQVYGFGKRTYHQGE